MNSPVTTAGKQLPPNPYLDQYKKQSRDLLNDLHQRNPEALARLGALPRPVETPRLSDAQLIIAREHGFASWPKFRLHLETMRLAGPANADEFIALALDRRRYLDAGKLLAKNPRLSRANIYAAVTCGDVDATQEFLDRDPALMHRPGGPRNRVPLLYACFTWFIVDREADVLSTVRILLDRGADPNATYREEPYMDYPCGALYSACGVLNSPTMATMLIDAGANVNDNESLYHSVEHRNHACTRLLLSHGAKGNVLNHQLDYDDVEGLALLLVHGANPNDLNDKGENSLHWALFRNRSNEHIALLIAHGVDVNTANRVGLTPYRMALRLGRIDTAQLLQQAGATADTNEIDQFIAAATAQDSGAIVQILSNNPNVIHQLNANDLAIAAHLAAEGATDQLSFLLNAGFPVDARGTHNATLLHWAAWYARVQTVKMLIVRGAPQEATGASLGSTPLQWAFHASGNNGEIKQADIIGVIEALLDAGAHYDPAWLDMASAEVKAWLQSIGR